MGFSKVTQVKVRAGLQAPPSGRKRGFWEGAEKKIAIHYLPVYFWGRGQLMRGQTPPSPAPHPPSTWMSSCNRLWPSLSLGTRGHLAHPCQSAHQPREVIGLLIVLSREPERVGSRPKVTQQA